MKDEAAGGYRATNSAEAPAEITVAAGGEGAAAIQVYTMPLFVLLQVPLDLR